MQKKGFLIACLFICAGCIAQEYPFVHYTPKDGLISNQIRSIYQDSKGRLYFTSLNGLSIYDGSRFINYNSKKGMESDIVNCVMEMGNDSLWIVTNDSKIYCTVNGKLKSVIFKEPHPLIDNLIRDEKGDLFAASEHGLYLFHQTRFEKLPFIDLAGKDINSYIANIYPAGKYLLVVRDNSLVAAEEKHVLYLYDKQAKKIVAETQKEIIYCAAKAPDGRIWVSTKKGILSLDTMELKKGEIVFQKLPGQFVKLKDNNISFLSFDQKGNCWLSDKVFALKKVSTDGTIISFTRATGLSSMDISHVFRDGEGTTWIASFDAGIDKLVNSNFSIYPDVSGISAINSISYASGKNQMLVYSPNNARAIVIEDDGRHQVFDVNEADKFQLLFATPKGLLGFSGNAVYRLTVSGNRIYPKKVLADTVGNITGDPLTDKNDNIILCGKDYLTVVIDEQTFYRKKINDFGNYAAIDTFGNILLTDRTGEVSMYRPSPDDLSNYLEQQVITPQKLPGISPRSVIIDKNNNIWIGTRSDGIHVFKLQKQKLIRQFYLNQEMGLSDNFITRLACDADNSIWVCSPSGLDKVSIRNGTPVIENLTKQNNIYQRVLNVVIDKRNNAWVLLHNNLIKIAPENRQSGGYSPSLIISMLKSGKDTVKIETGAIFSYKQNNLSFYFAATSFLDEKQVLYSYRLKGGSNPQWSESSGNAFVSFVDLHPGDYTLDIKATFPAGRYPQQIITYKFIITPPWWQKWWFRTLAGLLITGLLITGIRFYYRRKLEKERSILEKQQAIEKERTRIATDMHDELGAGLSRIKFLSQSLSDKEINNEMVKADLEKIAGYSDEMTEKMGEIVWALNEKNDTLADLVAYARSYAVEYLSGHDIQCKADTPLHLPDTFIPGEIRRNIFLTVKECLHNIVKHANATQVFFSVELNGAIRIVIHDNGKGIDWNNQRAFSNGIQNIKKRMNEIKGKADFLNDRGTKVLLVVPLAL